MICKRCLLDDKTPSITFDKNGECNYCKMHDQFEREFPTGKAGKKKLEELAEKIKKDGRGKDYDCVIGVSGGCDSSYLCWLAKEVMGLRPVAAHFDNTWNSKIAVENIHRVLNKLDIPLYTYVMDNGEFNRITKSFFKAGLPEVDGATDIALTTTLYMAAEKYKVKHILNGHSFRTEGIAPLGWTYVDAKYIESVHKRNGDGQIKYLPNLWLSKWLKWLLMGIERHRPLYYVDYHKEDVKKFLIKNLNWQNTGNSAWYGGHHMENRFTLFGNNYLLPKRFGIDLRKVEFSALVRSGQMTRDEALERISEPLECPEDLVTEFKKRLELTDEEFEALMNAPHHYYYEYETYKPTFKLMRPFFWLMWKTGRVPKTFYDKFTK